MVTDSSSRVYMVTKVGESSESLRKGLEFNTNKIKTRIQ